MANLSKHKRRRQDGDRDGKAQPASGPRSNEAPLAAAVCVFLLVAVGLVFGQTLRHEFINYDDPEYILENSHVRLGLTAESVAWAFTTRHAGNWHPITWLSHMVDCQLFGLSAGGHHAASAILHAATAIVLFLTLWNMTSQLWPSTFVAAVFAIHPLRAQSVAWAAERKDVLSGLFFALTLAAYVWHVRRPSLVRYLLVAALFAGGLMSKPMLVTLPLLLLLFDYWPLKRWTERPEGGRGDWRKAWPLLVEKIPLVVLSAASCLATAIVQQKAVSTLESVPVAARIGNALVSYWVYVGQTFNPAGLALLYPYRANDIANWKAAAAGIALLGVTAAAVAYRRRAPYFAVGWLWYLGMLVPVIGLVTIGNHAHADRYTYLPQIGLCVALAWSCSELLRGRRALKRLCGLAAALILATSVCLAWKQTSYWRDAQTIWMRSLACTLQNYTAHNNLATALAARGDVDGANEHFLAAVKIKPDFADAQCNLGMQLAARGEIDGAVSHYQAALQADPQHADAHNNLGNVFARRGQLDKAIGHFQQAIETRPEYVRAHFNLGTAWHQKGDIDKAVTHWRAAVQFEPNFAFALNQLAWVLATCPDDSIRNGTEAIALAKRAVQLSDPPDPAILGTLAAAYAEAGRSADAVATARWAVALATARNNRPLADMLRTRLDFYRSGKSYREPPGNQ